jgi:prevent-host-death family protein
MKTFTAEDARRDFRRLLDAAQQGGEPVAITRWRDTVAVLVSDQWYRRAAALMEREDEVTAQVSSDLAEPRE